ncbi:hypothetical protein BpHYR1_007387 [Brachionus plicatilis]|uniref:Uncharacterized protein n=1 Tax=Brachionus plicatilis TaxID=10195 RepID=A0A3M7P7T4_BRAPC|nr:hypothetical protein BpHYR1_007387 [Brachionus plicatilis]
MSKFSLSKLSCRNYPHPFALLEPYNCHAIATSNVIFTELNNELMKALKNLAIDYYDIQMKNDQEQTKKDKIKVSFKSHFRKKCFYFVHYLINLILTYQIGKKT